MFIGILKTQRLKFSISILPKFRKFWLQCSQSFVNVKSYTISVRIVSNGRAFCDKSKFKLSNMASLIRHEWKRNKLNLYFPHLHPLIWFFILFWCLKGFRKKNTTKAGPWNWNHSCLKSMYQYKIWVAKLFSFQFQCLSISSDGDAWKSYPLWLWNQDIRLLCIELNGKLICCSW